MPYEDVAIPRRGKLLLIGCAAVAVAALTVTAGVSDRARSMQEADSWTQTQAVPTVSVVEAKAGPGEEELTLPGNVAAFYSSQLYARASGYVTEWHHDIGARVKKGDVLATISAPDLDQQLAEGRANLVQLQAGVEQAQANADLGDATNKRTSRLVVQGWSSESQGDTDRFTAASRKAALAVAKANVLTQQAAVGRLEELARFKEIKAPFDGVVTARAIDVGDLVNAGGNSGKALFRVADLHRMRIYVDVPQAFYGAMKPGLTATLHVPGQPAPVAADVVSTSNAVSEDSRKALVELQADNPDGKLWPGAFAEVQFHIPSDPQVLRLPATALIFDKQGLRVAAVQPDSKLVLKPVEIGRNLGNEVEVRKGVVLGERYVDNPLETLQQGDVVRINGGDGPPAKLATLGSKTVER